MKGRVWRGAVGGVRRCEGEEWEGVEGVEGSRIDLLMQSCTIP